MAHRIRRTVLAALALGAIAVGASAIADAASNKSSTGSQGSSATRSHRAPNGVPPQRQDENLLSGDTAAKVKEAALAKVKGATVIRVETDAEGSPYEAHLHKSDGTLATVKVDKQFDVTAVEQGFGPGPGGAHGPGGPGGYGSSG